MFCVAPTSGALRARGKNFFHYPSHGMRAMGRILLVLLALAAAARGQESCLSVDPEPYLKFATKTAYIFANGDKGTSRIHEVPGCSASAAWLLLRPGAHNPEAGEVRELQSLQQLRDTVLHNYRSGTYRDTEKRMCPADLATLERWRWSERHNLSRAGELASDGYMQAQQLAQAWRQKYPALLGDNPRDYLFKHVDSERSLTTLRAFAEGLFGARAADLDLPRRTEERLLLPFRNCALWTRDVALNNATRAELEAFQARPEYKDMVSDVSRRLGFSQDLDAAAARRVYQMCRYNKAWDVNEISPWCAAFTKSDLQVLEYAEDLDTYFRYGHGSPLNARLGCGLLQDVMNYLYTQVDHAESGLQPRVVVSIAEAPTLLLLQAALGGRAAAPLAADAYRTLRGQTRKWSTSAMVPFNANLGVVLYRCNLNHQNKEPFKVLFLENEQQMFLEGCRVGLCDWSYVKQRYAAAAQQCDLRFCNGAATINGLLAVAVTVVGLLVSHVDV